MGLKELRDRVQGVMQVPKWNLAPLGSPDMLHMLHKLQLRQIELELQNEALRSALQQSQSAQEEHRELFECAPLAYMRLRGTGEVVQANAAAFGLLNVSRESLVGCNLRTFICSEDRWLLDELLQEAQPQLPATAELRMQPRGDESFRARLDVRAVLRSTQEYLVLLAASKRALDHAHALPPVQIEQPDRPLTGEADRLESLGVLAGGVAHNFNNLLVSVLGNADLLSLAPGIPAEWMEPLSQIIRASRDASELTRQLLIFAGRGKVYATKLSPSKVVAERLEFLRSQLQSTVQLRVRLQSELPSIDADRGQLEQAVMNLLTNAVEAIDGHGAIFVQTRTESLDANTLASFQHGSTAEPGQFVTIHVQDSGCGIDRAHMSRIFEPFFSTKLGGRGLGLAMLLGIVQSHGGAIRVRTQRGRGSIFEVALPVSSQLPQAPVRDLVETEWKASGRVLLIDDDHRVRHVVGRLLEYIGFEVTDAASGEAGLALYRANAAQFRLVILDWIMPGLSGKGVLRELRQLDADQPVLVISGFSAEDIETIDPRVICVQKPMTMEQLSEAARLLLRMTPHLTHHH